MKKREKRPKSSVKKRALYSFKASDSEMKEIRRLANLYADGNMSLWIRIASTNHVPASADFVPCLA